MNVVDRILVIDDDVDLCSLVAEYLRREGFQVEAVHDGKSGLNRALTGDHLLVVLDVMLPALNGFDVLRRLRDGSRIPVLLLTARGEDVDRIVGLEIGADDYLPKPFNPRELLARIRAILRRPETAAKVSPTEPISVGDVTLQPGSRTVTRGGERVELTAVEFDLLQALLRSAGAIVSRDQLARGVLGREFSPFDRSIDMHISKLRRKLGDLPGGQERIRTVRSAGYLYAAEPARKTVGRK